MPILEVERLNLFRSARSLVDNFSYGFNRGEIYAIVGDNGSGKTTLLATLAGLLPTNGRIIIDGKCITTMSLQTRARTLSFLQQHSPIEAYCSVADRIAHGLVPSMGFANVLDEKHSLLVKTLAARFSLEHLLNRKLGHLSGGEQRLVHLAKCLINPLTAITLLDEPSVFLDFTQTDRLIINLTHEAKNGRLIIFASHDRDFINRCASRVLILSNRTLRESTV